MPSPDTYMVPNGPARKRTCKRCGGRDVKQVAMLIHGQWRRCWLCTCGYRWGLELAPKGWVTTTRSTPGSRPHRD